MVMMCGLARDKFLLLRRGWFWWLPGRLTCADVGNWLLLLLLPGAEAMAVTVKGMLNLVTLSLGGNYIGEAGRSGEVAGR